MITIAQQYECTKVEICLNGQRQYQHQDEGGDLVQALAKLGVQPLCDFLWTQPDPFASILLTDGLHQLELHRSNQQFTMKMFYADGTQYEQHFYHTDSSKLRTAQPSSNMLSQVQQAANSDGQACFTDLNPNFCKAHQVKAPYIAGAMAGGIASVQMVQAMSQAGYLAFFGSGGLSLSVIESALQELSQLKTPWGCNLLHNPQDPNIESQTVDLLLKYGVKKVSASAFMRVTKNLLRYRIAGIAKKDGKILTPNAIFAKISHPSLLEQFLSPPPLNLLNELLNEGHINQEEMRLAQEISMATDITMEADSGGHTDGRPLSVLLPFAQYTKNSFVKKWPFVEQVRIGAAGGLGDPKSILGAFAMGADYVLLGSIHQSTLEADTSLAVKELLCEVGIADCAMAAAPDMFEQGVKVQVLSKGTMYAARANKLFALYREHDSIETLSESDLQFLQKHIFQKSIDEIWQETQIYWQKDPQQIEKALQNSKYKMALLFRWYLGQSSRWARKGEVSRKRDYQIWCGPSIGLFNTWIQGKDIEDLSKRGIVKVVEQLLREVMELR